MFVIMNFSQSSQHGFQVSGEIGWEAPDMTMNCGLSSARRLMMELSRQVLLPGLICYVTLVNDPTSRVSVLPSVLWVYISTLYYRL